jgi:hypothetical protein
MMSNFLSKLSQFWGFWLPYSKGALLLWSEFSLPWSRRHQAPTKPKNKSRIFIYSRNINQCAFQQEQWQVTTYKHNLFCNSELVGECLPLHLQVFNVEGSLNVLFWWVIVSLPFWTRGILFFWYAIQRPLVSIHLSSKRHLMGVKCFVLIFEIKTYYDNTNLKGTNERRVSFIYLRCPFYISIIYLILLLMSKVEKWEKMQRKVQGGTPQN